MNHSLGHFFLLYSSFKKSDRITIVTLQFGFLKNYVINVVWWKKVMHCLKNFVWVLSCMYREPNVKIAYKCLRQSHATQLYLH